MEDNTIKLERGQKIKIILYQGPSSIEADALAMVIHDTSISGQNLNITGMDLKLKITNNEISSNYDIEADTTIYKVIVEGELV